MNLFYHRRNQDNEEQKGAKSVFDSILVELGSSYLNEGHILKINDLIAQLAASDLSAAKKLSALTQVLSESRTLSVPEVYKITKGLTFFCEEEYH